MQAAHLSPLRTLEPAPHAHPSPMHSLHSQDPALRLADLAASLPLAVKLEGPVAGDGFDVCAAYFPRVRRSNPSQEAVQHMDVIACWKGLTYSKASELVFWEQAFRDCLTCQVELGLRYAIAAQLHSQQRSLDGLSLLFDLNECIADVKQQVVGIDEKRLVDDMTNLYYERDEFFSTDRSYSWATGSGNLPRFLHNFLRTQDCLLQGIDGPKVLIVRTSYEYSFPVFNIAAEVMWSAPTIRFDDVPTTVQRNEMYRITPVYMEMKLAASAPSAPSAPSSPSSPSSTLGTFPNQICYELDPSNSAAYWDSDHGCFFKVASAPSTTEPDPTIYTDNTCLSTIIITPFPGDVQFERISRHRITVNVAQTTTTRPFAPILDPLATFCTKNSFPKTTAGGFPETTYNSFHSMDSAPRKRKAESLNLDFDPSKIPDHEDSSLNDTLHERLPDTEKRRKITSPENEPAASSSSRPSHADEEGYDGDNGASETNDEDGQTTSSSHTQVHISPNDQANTSPLWSTFNAASQNAANQNAANQTSANQTSANQTSANQTSANQTSANQTSANQTSANQNAANQTSASQSSATAQASEPPHEPYGTSSDWQYIPFYSNTGEAIFLTVPPYGLSRHDSVGPPEASSGHSRSPELSQAEIVQNYREFEEQAKIKTTSKGSAHSDDFADIFLEEEDAEDWVSDEESKSD